MKQCSHFVYQYTPISELALYLFFVSVVVVVVIFSAYSVFYK